MSGSVSPLPWTGSKGCIYTTIDAFMPPHKTYVEACMGSAEVFLRKKPSEREIINDYNGDLVKFFRVLQRSEKLAYLIGRLYLSFNSEQLFKANKAILADVPNILDDLTETSVIIENADWSDIEKAVAFFENQIFSFSSTGKTFAIAKKDMTKRFGRLVAACSRLRNVALTRTKNRSYVMVDEQKPSEFFKEFVSSKSVFITNSASKDAPEKRIACPRCKTGYLMVRKNERSNKYFVGCTNFPKCDYTVAHTSIMTENKRCPRCGGFMIRRKGRFGEFWGCSNYPSCNYTEQEH